MEINNRSFFSNPSRIVAILWTLFQLWIVYRGAYPSLIQRPIHVGFALCVIFLSWPMLKKTSQSEGYGSRWYEYIFVLGVLACIGYMCMHSQRLMTRIAFVDDLTLGDKIVGVVFVVLLFEASRRVIDKALIIIALLFVAYGFLGGNLQGMLGHNGQNLQNFLEVQVFSTSGIFSSPISVSVSMVFYFLLFGAFLTATPAGELFINLSNLFTRKTRGGAGKASIVASALFGMISGSAPANVASVGMILYPSMKKEGFSPVFSGGILAIGGTAGQLIPPVMGAAAFIMVDMAGTSYGTIMKAAIIPSTVFMCALYFLTHFYAKKNNLSSPDISVADLKLRIYPHLHLLLSVVALVYFILSGYSVMRAATLATLVLIVLCMLGRSTRLHLYDVLRAFESTARQAIIVAIPCALSGIIIGQIVQTGLGLRFTSLINSVAQSSMFIALFLTMLMALILGMGMPTSAAYIMTATLLAPTLIGLRTPVLVAHFFVFYFSNLSMITPPVALSSFTAAGIVGVDMWSIGIEAFKNSFIVFLIPYTFVYNPALLGMGNTLEILQVFATMILGVYALGSAIIGYGLVPLYKAERFLLILASLLLVFPEPISDAIGLAIFVICILWQRKRRAISTEN